MQTILVEINNPKAFTLLQELEDLKIIKILKDNVLKTNLKLSDKYKGVFTKKDAENFNKHTQIMRKEWDNI
jgi:protein tyrosine/serine phosphatase